MKTPFILLVCLFLAVTARAQWQTDTYTLKGGWNAIYLHGDATHDTIENLVTNTNVEEIWRWVPNPDRVQYVSTPSVPAALTPEWQIWRRTLPPLVVNDMTTLTGQNAYLVKCAGTTANTYTISLTHRPLPPRAVWLRHGANLLGFPSRLNGANYPIFNTYFAAFPSAVASGVKIFKYIGGDLNTTNPQQIFSTASERVNRLQAYWFDTELVNNYTAPVEIELGNAAGLVFGDGGSTILVRLRNRGSTSTTVTLASTASATPPSGQTVIVGQVPLSLRSFNSTTGDWSYTPVTAAITQTLAGNATVDLVFAVNRGHASMLAQAANPGALFASLLRVTDSTNLTDVYLPVSAVSASVAGLWVGDATVTNVQSTIPGSGSTTRRPYTLRYLFHVDASGQARLLSQVFSGRLTSTDAVGLTSKEAGLKTADKATAKRMSVSHLVPETVIGSAGTGNSGSIGLGGALQRRVVIDYANGVNPFVHSYHPDHDNLNPRFVTLPAGVESWTLQRDLTFTFSTTPTSGSNPAAWGATQLGGTYSETLTGAHKLPLTVTGTFMLNRVSSDATLVQP